MEMEQTVQVEVEKSSKQFIYVRQGCMLSPAPYRRHCEQFT